MALKPQTNKVYGKRSSKGKTDLKREVKSRHIVEKEDLAFLTKQIPELEQQYKDFFDHKLPREPKALRKQIEAIIDKYTKSPFIKTVNKYKFSTLVSRYTTYKVRWDKKLRELALKEIVGEREEISEVEKRYLNKIVEQF